MIYGSVADRVLRSATVPVLLVPAHSSRAWPTDQPLSVLVPLDGSPLAEEALASAQLLSEAFAAHINLLRVVEPPAYPLYGDGYTYIPYDEETELAQARQYIDQQVSRLQAAGRHATGRVVVGQPRPAALPNRFGQLWPKEKLGARHGLGHAHQFERFVSTARVDHLTDVVFGPFVQHTHGRRDAAVFREHVYVSPFHEEDIRGLAELIGPERVLFGSDWPHGEGYRIEITGEPHVHVELSVTSDRGDHNHAGCLATAMHVINAIPHVVASEPGVLTTLDLPVYSAKHLMTPTAAG